MAKTKRKRQLQKNAVNPYLFHLAKRLAQFHFFGLQKPNDLQFVKSIYNHYKSKDFQNTTYIDASQRTVKRNGIVTLEKVRLDPYAKSIAKRIHKIFKTQDLCFTDKMLDYLVCEIKALVFDDENISIQFKSWKEFGEYFQDDRGVIEAERLCAKVPYFDLLESDKQIIRDVVEYKFLKLASTQNRFGDRFEQYPDGTRNWKTIFIANSDSFTIRTTQAGEVRWNFSLRDNSATYETRRRGEVMSRWLEVNPLTVFLYLDEHGVGGFLSILPVTVQWFQDLLNGETFAKPVLSSDIISPWEDKNIEYVYIELVRGATPRIKALLIYYLPFMLEKVVGNCKRDFLVLYISSQEENRLMKDFGFREVTTLFGKSKLEVKSVYLAQGKSILEKIGR